MSYRLNKTDGTLLVDLIDGQIDNESSDLVLVGRNYSGFGEFLNENYIKLLENFSNSAPPSNPLSGQLWYDTSDARLKVFDGDVFKSAGGPIVQATLPDMVAGDLWIDNLNNQLYAYDGTDLMLVGPSYKQTQGLSGFTVEDILDVQSRSRTVLKLWIGGSLVGVVSSLEFTPALGQEIAGIEGNILKGFNLVDDTTFKFNGVATSSNGLITDTGIVKNASQFLPADANGTTVGTLTIQNSGGLTIGLSQNNVQKVVADSFVIENQLRDHDLKLRVRSSVYQSLIVDAVTVKAANARVGIFQANPDYTLDVNGDLRVTGNFIVEGSSVAVETQRLRVQDKNIELGLLDDSTEGNDATIDGGGIIVRSSEGSKDWLWDLTTDSWTSNVNVNLDAGNSFKINGVDVLTANSLGQFITKAPAVDQVGTLNYLDVEDIHLEGTTITTAGTGLFVKSDGNINVTNAAGAPNTVRISGIADPTAQQDVATKEYVDREIGLEPVAFSLDITGLSDAQIALVIESLYPAANKRQGTQAFIHTTTITGATVTGIDVDSVATKTTINVDKGGVPNSQVVLRDIAFADASGTVNVTIQRGRKRFVVNNSQQWIFDADLAVGI